MQFKWFKNLRLFRFQTPVTLTAETLGEKLTQSPFRPCGDLEWFTSGWVSPLAAEDGTADPLVYEANHCLLFTLRRQEKILPAATIRDKVKERLAFLKKELGRNPRKYEKEELKKQVTEELLPQALPRNVETSAYIDLKQGWLIINTSSNKKAEEFTVFLRESLGSLPVELPLFEELASQMTHWLHKKQTPTTFSFGEDCRLIAPEGESVTCKRVDLCSVAVQEHLHAGKTVEYLGLQWDSRLAFVLDQNFIIRRLKYLEVIPDAGDDFYADFTVMTIELARFFNQLFKILD